MDLCLIAETPEIVITPYGKIVASLSNCCEVVLGKLIQDQFFDDCDWKTIGIIFACFSEDSPDGEDIWEKTRELLDEKTIKNYTNYEFPIDAKLPARSDILRIILLKKYGGIWADATMLCLDSINKWVSNVEPSKFWMYHGLNNACTFTISQLIMSYPNEYIINKWYDKVINFWLQSRITYEYESRPLKPTFFILK